VNAPPPPNTTFHPGLEGLRGLAILSTVLFHHGFSWASGGFVGVSTFFTLSGFLITSLLLTQYQNNSRINLLKFWGRRARRLMPAALLALLGIALYGYLAASEDQVQRLFGDGVAALFYVSNWWLIATDAAYSNLLGDPSLVQHFWSLAIEEQYYVFYPIVLLILLRLGKGSLAIPFVVLGLLSAASLVTMAWLANTIMSTDRIYYGTDTRSAELLMGGMLAIILKRWKIPSSELSQKAVSIVGLLALLLATYHAVTFNIADRQLYKGGLAIHALTSLVIIVAAITPSGPVRYLLSLPWVRWLGRISYGVYVYHWPIFLWLDAENTQLSQGPLFVLRFIVSITIAFASYHLIEMPIRNGYFSSGRKQVLAVATATAVTFIAFFLATSGVGPRHSLLDFIGETDLVAVRELAAPDENILKVYVVGDSVAMQMATALEEWGNETGKLKTYSGAFYACGMARGGYIGKDAELLALCDNWDLRFGKAIDKHRPQIAVVYTASWDTHEKKLPQWSEPASIGNAAYDSWLYQQYDAAVTYFAQRGLHVAWVSPICLRRADGGEGPYIPSSAWFNYLDDRIVRPLALSRPRDITRIDLRSVACHNEDMSNQIIGHQNFKPDGMHYSEEGIQWLGGWLGLTLVELANQKGL
jgi:peptidoglycan/LPS O-acetylase OafA/YrhL